MSKVLTEKQYQRYIIDYLVEHNGYIERTDENFDRLFALDRELLFKFLEDTQPDEVKALKKIYKEKYEETLINFINTRIISTSLLETLKHGVEPARGIKLNLMYTKPATEFNKELTIKYSKNIFSVAEEVYAKDKERIDLVLFLNGFAIITIELKCNASGQNYENAIRQFRTDRDPKSRLFLFKAGAVVNFAMDLEECHMTTKLDWLSTYFLPFNKGNGEGIDTGKGNPLNEDGFGVSYVWEDILQKDHLIEILSKFVFVERKEKELPNGKKKIKESIIFPRYHQLDCIRKTLDDVVENRTSQNYLIQHSAGSGKTYTIAWLAHRLASLHDKDNKQIYDNIVIVTDRVVVDRQLQQAVSAIEHKTGLIKVMNDKCTSADLKTALEGNTKIIATTIQKFPYIADNVKGLREKYFAVIIDEAHSSTSGKDMAAVTKVLGSDVNYEDDAFNMDAEDIITDEICSHGKQNNVSMFAFTATPKPTTLALFGKLNTKGQHEAFHLYSMKQAIEEGFILNVLQSFTPYETFYKINKEIDEDPKYKTKAAKRKIARFAMLHDTNISQRIEIIIEHFRDVVLKDQPWAKAMVVTGSRAEAVKYYKAFIEYTDRKGYQDVHPLVAFTGKINEKQLGISDDTEKYFTESSINGFSDDYTAKNFDEGNYQVLLVANKYQTGFDQPKLCAMYVLKSLSGINAVQTLSRLNRICPPYDKKTFILDFVNSIEQIENAFKKYYTTTLLCNTVTPELVYELDTKIDGYFVFTLEEAEKINEIFYDNALPDKKKEESITYYLSKAKKNFERLDEKDQEDYYLKLRHFVRFYEFLLQVSSFNDVDLHKKYNFIVWLLPYLKIGRTGTGFDLKDKIEATNFYQKKNKEITVTKILQDPTVNLPTAETFKLTDDEEKKLSDIIKEVNSKTGKQFDSDVTIKAALQIRDLLKKRPDIIASAKSNTLDDFEFTFYSGVDDALVDGLQQNQEFFTMLLNNDDMKKEIMGIFLKSIYLDFSQTKDKNAKNNL